MAIYYPSTTSGGSINRPQYAVNIVLDSTFPIVISGTTSQTQVCNIFMPPPFLYQMSGAYCISYVYYYTGSADSKFSLDFTIPGVKTLTGSLINYQPFEGAPNMIAADRLAGNSGYALFNDITEVPFEKGASIPLMGSGSSSNYTASIYAIYFSPMT